MASVLKRRRPACRFHYLRTGICTPVRRLHPVRGHPLCLRREDQIISGTPIRPPDLRNGILPSVCLHKAGAFTYDISYRVCADHEFFLTMYLKGISFDYLPIPVSVYEIAGFSDRNKMLSHKEKIRMQRELGIFHVTPSWILRECSFYGKQTIKNLFGQKLIRMVRKRRLH